MNKNIGELKMTNLFTQLINISENDFKKDKEQEPLRFKGISFYAEFNDDLRAVKIITVKASYRGEFVPTQKMFGGELCDLVEVDATNSCIYKGKKIYHWDLLPQEEITDDDCKYLNPRTAELINKFNKLCYVKSWSYTKKSEGYWSEFWRFEEEFLNKNRDVFEKGSHELERFKRYTGKPRFSYGFKFNHVKFLEKFNAHLEKKQITKEKLEQKKRQRELEKARVSDMVECPVCHGYAEWEKIHGEKVVYDHGFTVGYGHRNNPCFGSRYNCWEKSPKGKQDFLNDILRNRFKFIMRNQPTQERLNEINSKVVEIDQKIKELNANKTMTPKDRKYELSFLQYQYPTFIGYRICVKLGMVLLTKLWTDAKNKTKEDILATIKMLRDWKEQPTLNERKAEIQESMEISKPKKRKLTGAEMRRAFFG